MANNNNSNSFFGDSDSDAFRMMETLEARTFLSATTFSEFDTTSIDVPDNGSVNISGEIETIGGEDYYTFTAPANGKIVVEMDGLGDLDSYLTLYKNKNGKVKQVKANNNANRSVTDSIIKTSVKAGDVFYIKADAYKDSTVGEYTITVTSIPKDDLGDTAEDAKVLKLNKKGTTAKAGWINYASDVDVFEVTATADGHIEAVLTGYSSKATESYNISVTDSEGQVLDTDGAVNGHIAVAAFDVTEGQTYYIHVSSDDGDDGKYRLGVDINNVLHDNPSLDLPAEGSVSVSGTIETIGGEDYYTFTALATGKITIEMDGHGSLNSYLTLYKEKYGQIKKVKSNDNANRKVTDSLIKISAKAGDVFYIKAAASDGATAGDYDITVTSTPKDDYSDSVENAKIAKVNKYGSGSKKGWVNYTTDVDLFKINATVDGYMEVTMAGLGSKAVDSCQISVVNTAGQILNTAEGFSSATAEAGFEVSAGQSYYIYVSSAEGDVGKYKITMATSEIAEDNDEDVPDDNTGGDDDPVDPVDNEDDIVVDPSGIALDQFSAGAVVSASYYDHEGATLLIVLGTDGSDWIEIGVNSGNILVNDGQNVSAYDANVDGLIVLGFDGDDYLRSDASMTISTGIYGGEGNDSLYDAGSGEAELSGGNGDDLIVSIGGGSDVLIGNAGLDSFWADSSDSISDASSLETGVDSVHVVNEFYQPYSSNKSSSNYVPLTIAGQNFIDPETTGYANGWVNYSSSPLFVDTPVYSDIDQGAVGDCYFLSVLAGYAHDDPQVIKQMITDLGDGTYAVRFYRSGKAQYVRVDADLPVTGDRLSYAGLGEDGEIWVAIAEKAYAHFRYGDNSYDSLTSGWMNVVYEEITNRDSALKWTSGMSTTSMFNYVSGLLADGNTVSVGSKSGGSGPIAGGHAYAILGVSTEDGQDYVTVYNPWGLDGRVYDSNYYDGVMKITAQQFKDAFVAVTVSYA